MRLSEFVVRQAIIPQMEASTKEGVIREMIASLKVSRLLAHCLHTRAVAALKYLPHQGPPKRKLLNHLNLQPAQVNKIRNSQSFDK